MENIGYFCIVKSFVIKKALFVVLLVLLLPSRISATNEIKQTDELSAWCDSIEISLLTCSPHDEIYSLYGHTAIRYHDKMKGLDLAVNYGVFSFQKPNFVLRFVFGQTDYEMGLLNFDDFCKEYIYYGAKVTQQTLNLSRKEKLCIMNALQKNYEPANRVYRYNFFYNNCTTKARDIIADNIDGKIIYSNKINEKESFREIIHSRNNEHRWARFGNDLLLGVKADMNTTRCDQQFLPANLQRDFDHAVIERNGKRIPLVTKTSIVVDATTQGIGSKAKEFPTPTTFACVIFIFILASCVTEKCTKRKLYAVDILFMLLCGLAGIVLFTMLFSLHPTTSTNLQIILLNPIPLFLIFLGIKNRKEENKLKAMWKGIIVAIILAIVCSFIQDFAEGMRILALSLLLRSIWNLYFPTKEKLQKRN